jgi:hypothetical protein
LIKSINHFNFINLLNHIEINFELLKYNLTVNGKEGLTKRKIFYNIVFIIKNKIKTQQKFKVKLNENYTRNIILGNIFWIFFRFPMLKHS